MENVIFCLNPTNVLVSVCLDRQRVIMFQHPLNKRVLYDFDNAGHVCKSQIQVRIFGDLIFILFRWINLFIRILFFLLFPQEAIVISLMQFFLTRHWRIRYIKHFISNFRSTKHLIAKQLSINYIIWMQSLSSCIRTDFDTKNQNILNTFEWISIRLYILQCENVSELTPKH